MRPEFLKFIRGLFKKAIKNQNDAVIKKNKIREILEILATDKKVAEAIMTPETEEALGYLVEEACKIECSVNQDSKIREFIENWLDKNRED